MPSAWSRGGVWCRAGTEAFSNLSCEMLNPKKLQAPRSHPSLWAASAHGPGCASEEGLGWFSLHPASSKADHGLFFWQQDGRHAWKTSSKHPLPLASTAVSDPKSTSRAQQLHPQPCCSHFGQHCSVLSFSFPGMSHGHGDSCTGMDMVMPLGCCCGWWLCWNPKKLPLLQEPRITCAMALPPCTIPATPVGKGLLSSQALIAELALITTWPKGKLQLARWPRDSPWKIRPCPTSPLRMPRCKSRLEAAFPGVPGTVHRCVWAGDGVGVSPEGSGGGRAAADTRPTQPWHPRALEGAAWQRLPAVPGRDVCRALGRTGLAVASLAPALAP